MASEGLNYARFLQHPKEPLFLLCVRFRERLIIIVFIREGLHISERFYTSWLGMNLAEKKYHSRRTCVAQVEVKHWPIARLTT